MKVTVRGRNVVVTEWIEEYVAKKSKRLERLVPDVDEMRCEITETNARSDDDRFTVQLTLWANGQILRAEETTSDIFMSIDQAADKVVRQVERFKGRASSVRRKAAVNHQQSVEATLVKQEEEEATEDEAVIVRRKQFDMQPMTEDEAVEQMELLGHDFFLFYNVDARTTNLIYRRRDGNYGLLQPQLI